MPMMSPASAIQAAVAEMEKQESEAARKVKQTASQVAEQREPGGKLQSPAKAAAAQQPVQPPQNTHAAEQRSDKAHTATLARAATPVSTTDTKNSTAPQPAAPSTRTELQRGPAPVKLPVRQRGPAQSGFSTVAAATQSMAPAASPLAHKQTTTQRTPLLRRLFSSKLSSAQAKSMAGEAAAVPLAAQPAVAELPKPVSIYDGPPGLKLAPADGPPGIVPRIAATSCSSAEPPAHTGTRSGVTSTPPAAASAADGGAQPPQGQRPDGMQPGLALPVQSSTPGSTSSVKALAAEKDAADCIELRCKLEAEAQEQAGAPPRAWTLLLECLLSSQCFCAQTL